MTKIHTHNTETAIWHSLVGEAQAKSSVYLEEDLESYLVFLLMRFTSKTDIANAILALEFLDALKLAGSLKQDTLREVGDKCLILAGLFPERSKRKNVRKDYFVSLGKNAYATITDSINPLNCIFNKLHQQFMQLTDVLQHARNVADDYISPNIQESLELLETMNPNYILEKKLYTTLNNKNNKLH